MPFTNEEFLNVFEVYNNSVFPIQILFNVLALTCVLLILKSSRLSNKIINGTLSILLLWTGLVYHIMFFAKINGAAYLFGILFILQACIFFYIGVIKDNFRYNVRKDWIGVTGWILIAYALIIYPILGYSFGHGYPQQPTFGLPCPTTIFTFGILLFTSEKIKWQYIVLLLLWSFLGVSAAIKMRILEDIGLVIAGILSFSIIVFYDRRLVNHNKHKSAQSII